MAISVSLCLSVCLSANVSQKPEVKVSTKFLLHAACGRGSVLFWLSCITLCALPVLWMTSCLPTIAGYRPAEWTRTEGMLNVTHQGAASGKSLMSTFAITLYLCHFVRKHISETTSREIRHFICVACGHAVVFLWWRCDTLCISGFADDVIFSHYGPNGGVFLLQLTPETLLAYGFWYVLSAKSP